jgi:hypothetical protein
MNATPSPRIAPIARDARARDGSVDGGARGAAAHAEGIGLGRGFAPPGHAARIVADLQQRTRP